MPCHPSPGELSDEIYPFGPGLTLRFDKDACRDAARRSSTSTGRSAGTILSAKAL